jgi:sugar lactone lactonase YvrE
VIASALDGLSAPEQLMFDERGNLYVTDEHAHGVFRISADGTVDLFISGADHGLKCPEAIALYNEHLYITDSCSVAVFRFSLDARGGAIIRFTRKYRDLAGIAIDDFGTLYVAVGSTYRPHNLILRVRSAE